MARRGLIAIGLALSVVLTGCSTVPGEAVPDAGALKLDTGNYPTTPREVPTASWGPGIQGNIVLSDYLVAAADLDAAFDRTLYKPFSSIDNANSMTNMIGDKLTYALLPGNVNGVVAQFGESGRAEGSAMPTMATFMFRYLTENDAATAFAQVKQIPPATASQQLAKYPAAHDGPAPTRFGGSPTIWLQHKEYVIATSFAAITDRARVDTLATAYFDRQLPRLAEVPFKPYEGRQQPTDKEGILRLTMADPTSDGYNNGYFSSRAWALHSVGAWKTTTDLYRTFGVDLVGSEGRNQVFRAADTERAESFVREVGARYARDGGGGTGGRLEASVPNLPGSVCISRYANVSGAENRIFTCSAARGRYIASTQASSLQQAQQSTAASWTVIKNAGN